MPRAYDRRQLPIDRSPLKQLSTDISKLPKVDPQLFIKTVINIIKEHLSEIPVFGSLVKVVERIQSLFGGVDFGASTFDPIAQLTSFIATSVNPLGLLAQLTGGKLKSGQEPQLLLDFKDIVGGGSNSTLVAIENRLSGLNNAGQLLASKLLGIPAALQQAIDGFVGGSNNPVSAFISALTGTRNTATTASNNAASAQSTANGAAAAASDANLAANDARSRLQQLFDQYLGGSNNPVSDFVNALIGVKSNAQNANTNAAAANTNANNALGNVVDGFKNMYNQWFGGSSAAGTPVEVQQTIAAIKQAVIGGYTVDTFTSNGTWTKPANLIEWWGITVGGGGKGMPGTTSATNADVRLGGAEGSSGGYIAQQIAPADVPASLSVTVGAGATTNGANGGITSIGSLVASSPNGSGISTIAGFTPASSTPGKGGAGGQATGSAGSAGTAGGGTPLAAGGAGGAGKTGGSGTATAGGAGGTASLTGPTKAGGGGGGGGGGNGSTGTGTKTGGAGGNGGYPGGGSGGGGAAVGGGSVGSSQVAGNPGTAPNGVAFIIYKTG